MSIPILDLGAPASYRELGERHGAEWGEKAAALFGIRWALTRKRSRIKDTSRLVRLAQAHVPFLAEYSPTLHEELLGLASTSGLEPWQLVILNHYTDFRDIPPDTGGCSVLFAPLPSGPVIAQTWDMHGTAEPFVGVLRLKPPDGPAAVLFTIAGCQGMCGLNDHGVAVCINNLTPKDGRIGALWPSLVREMLKRDTAAGAREVLAKAPLGSGHNYMVADETRIYNVETTAIEQRLTHDDFSAYYHHTNHYLHPDLLPLALPLATASTSFDRYAAVDRWLQESPPQTVEALWKGLGSHEGYPRSVCSHMAGSDPSSSKTCGAVICDLANRRILAHQGCLHDAEPTVVGVHADG